MIAGPKPAEVQAMCARLHAVYCAASGRPTPMLAGFARLWWDLLSSTEYAWDVERFAADVEHLVRYLKMGIRDAKRNDGALKLANFLQPDKYWEDLAEARVKLRPLRPARVAASLEAPKPEPMSLEAGYEIAAKLREFKERGLR